MIRWPALKAPLSLLPVLLSVLMLAQTGCDVQYEEPRGVAGVLDFAWFNHSLEGPLGPTPVALGARFAMSANRDRCDRLAEDCEDPSGELLLRSADPELLELTPRSDGAFGAFAKGGGSTVVFAIDADDEVVDFLDIQIAPPAAVALTDQVIDARRPRGLPLDWAVEAGQRLELRAAFVDRDNRVLLSGDLEFAVELELRDVAEGQPDDDAVLGPSLTNFGSHVRVRAPERAIDFRAVIFADDRSVDATVYRVSVLPPDDESQMRVEVQHVRSQVGFDVVEADLCAVRERLHPTQRRSMFMVGHGYDWQPPWGFELSDEGVGPFSSPGPIGSRCVRAVRFDDREVPPGERFYANFGESQGSVPYGVVLGQVKRPKVWWAPLWEGAQEMVSSLTPGG